nr:MAG TPA: hypothetical protein [Caudoviricetes sp.]
MNTPCTYSRNIVPSAVLNTAMFVRSFDFMN